MNAEQIVFEWEIDSKIDSTELGQESIKIPQLHSKYMKELYLAKTLLNKVTNDYKRIARLKHQYYQGILSKEELDELGWDVQPLKILKSDIPMYIESDVELQDIKMRIKATEDKIEILEHIIKTLNNRGFLLKNAIEWAKFQHGL